MFHQIRRFSSLHTEGGTLAVASLSGAKGGTVALINLETLRVDEVYSVRENTGSLAFASEGRSLYVASCGPCTKGALGGGLFDINLRTKVMVSLAGPYQQPGELALDPETNSLYVTLPSLGLVANISTVTKVLRHLIRVGGSPYGIVVSPNGRTVYISGGGGKIFPINAFTDKPMDPLQIDWSGPIEMAIAPDGRDLYVVDTASNKLVVIDAESNLIQKQIRVGSSPDQLVVTPNSSYIFVVSGSNRLVRVSANADAVTGSTAVNGQVNVPAHGREKVPALRGDSGGPLRPRPSLRLGLAHPE
jgi:YVTN family beta-propeller protein